jgi:hypothetical protein
VLHPGHRIRLEPLEQVVKVQMVDLLLQAQKVFLAVAVADIRSRVP